MRLSFLRLEPSSVLSEHVSNFWFMRGAGPSAMPEGHRILPDGCMEFVFQLGDPFREREPSGRWRMQNHFLFVGQMERRVDVQPTGAIDTVGIHFRPGGVPPFVAGDLSRFSNRITPLERALGEPLSTVVEQLRSSRTAEGRAKHLERFLQRRQTEGDRAMSKAVSRICETSGPVDLVGVARESGLSDRQFRRRFEAAVGIGPKRFFRLVRFQRVFEEKQEHDAHAWSRVALDCGYYDQAHFNRDFRAFSGVKPRDIVRDADPLTAFFLSVSSKTPGRGPG